MSNLIDQALDAYDRISNAFVDRAYEKAVPWLAKGAVPYMPADVPRTDESIPKYVGTFKLEIPAANVEAMANMAKDWRTLAAGLGPAQVEIFSSSRFLELKRGSGEYGPIQLGSHTIVRVPCPGSEEIGRRHATEARSSGCLSMTREKGLVIVMIRIGDDWFWVPFGW
jgi:hypothetical protein